MGMRHNSVVAVIAVMVVIFVVIMEACGAVSVLMVVRRPKPAADKRLADFPYIGTKSAQELQCHRIGLR